MLGFPRKIKKTFFAASSSLLLLAPAFAAAQTLKDEVGGGLETAGRNTGLGNASLEVTVGKVIGAFLGLLGVVMVVLVIYAGYLWMTAQGNEEQVTKAKTILKNAVIGMVILTAAYAISSFVLDAILTGTMEPAVDPNFVGPPAP